MDKLIKDHECSKWWIVAGFVSFGIAYNYSVFHNRATYLNRKKLLKYLQENEIGKPDRVKNDFKWELPNGRIWKWEGGCISYHENNSIEIICSFYSGISDTRNYNKIKKIINKNLEKYKEVL